MSIKFENLFDFEKKSIFTINLILIIIIILFFLFKIEIKFFFYLNLLITLFLSYIFFKKSKKIAKILILTNLFIFFYFLFPTISEFLYKIFGTNSYLFIIFYNVLISYLFLYFSEENTSFFGNIKKTNIKLLFSLTILSIFFGFLFFFIREPIPNIFYNIIKNYSFSKTISFIFINSFLVALSEQLIFSGFLFNSYKKLTSKSDAIFQTSIIFLMFHLLRFKILTIYYFTNFSNNFLIYLITYYILLFIFMNTCLYFYSLKNKKYEGNFIYPLIIHFVTDSTLFILSLINS